VDSAVSAYLLQQAGHTVVGGFMINYLTDDDSCPTRTDLKVAQEVADFLGIQLYTFDFVEEYEARVLHILYSGYAQGITPNPDVFCNNLVKFDLFAQESLSYGFDAIAMGHYAQTHHSQLFR
jgi:tRNA-specific 2-thiouridylase